MKEKGGHFIPSLGFALAAHALLFLLFFWLMPRIPIGPKVAMVDVQFFGSGGGSGGAPGGGAPAPGRAAPRGLRPARPATPVQRVPPAQAVPPAQPAAIAPPAQPQRAPAAPEASAAAGPAETSGQSGRGSGGSGDAGGAGSGDGEGSGAGGEAAGDWAAAPPATLADIDPVPIREISASYPPSARLLGQQGLVRVQVEVDKDGVVTEERIAKSSGFRLLDNAALEAVRQQARYMPAMKNGKPVAARGIVVIRFKLTQD